MVTFFYYNNELGKTVLEEQVIFAKLEGLKIMRSEGKGKGGKLLKSD